MRRLLTIVALITALGALSGCDPDGESKPSKLGHPTKGVSTSHSRARRKAGKALSAYAPATDFVGAAPEDAYRLGGALFDGSRDRGSVLRPGSAARAGARPTGKRIMYTAASSERITDLNGVVPPLPDDYDYSRSGATPGTARGAGATLLGFAQFQIQQRFKSIAPIMSRAGWGADARRGSNTEQTPYRVTVHHTEGHRAVGEADAKATTKGTQWYHMVGRGLEGKENFDDIGYHFLIAGDGRVIEGRHAEYLGAHAGGANDGNIGISMMGNFNKIKPSNAQIESLTRLVTYLSIKYHKDPSTVGFLEPHKHYTLTDCPGSNMMRILDALRHKIDKENELIVAGGHAGTDFVPLGVYDGPTA